MEGRIIYDDQINTAKVGVNYIQVETSTLSQGLYSFVFYNDANRVAKTIVKSE